MFTILGRIKYNILKGQKEKLLNTKTNSISLNRSMRIILFFLELYLSVTNSAWASDMMESKRSFVSDG